MNELISKIENFLDENKGNVITVSCGSQKLRKQQADAMRYAFSHSDIKNQYGSVRNLLEQLPNNGFTEQVQIALRKAYGNAGKFTYHNIKELTVNIKKREKELTNKPMETATTPMQQPMNYPNFGMGYTPVAQADWLETKIKESRYSDLERELKRVQNELLDTKSKLRIKEEEFATLKMKYDTEQERSELKLERDRLDRKSFFESDGFQQVLPALGAVLEKFVAPQNAGALGQPSNLSAIKQQLIAYIGTDTCTEEQAQFFAVIANNYSEEFVQKVKPFLKVQ